MGSKYIIFHLVVYMRVLFILVVQWKEKRKQNKWNKKNKQTKPNNPENWNSDSQTPYFIFSPDIHVYLKKAGLNNALVQQMF